jgi:assimilatory nitrate reductase catalytic subunit
LPRRCTGDSCTLFNAAANRAFGIDRGLPFPLSDLADADLILLVGSNAADTMPPFMQWLTAQRLTAVS